MLLFLNYSKCSFWKSVRRAVYIHKGSPQTGSFRGCGLWAFSFPVSSEGSIPNVIIHYAGEYTLSKASVDSTHGCCVKERRLPIRKSAPINVIVHYPATEEGKAELARRIAAVHAESVIAKLNRLNCPNKQKLDLLDAVIETVKHREKGMDR